MTKRLILACAVAALGTGASAQDASKPISRSDYMKVIDTRFATMDTNHDGKVSREEFTAQQAKDIQAAKTKVAQQLEARFRQLDTNKDGKLSLQEFMAAAPGVKTVETPEQMIQKFDSNHDGVVTADEFRAPELTKFNKVDANHDGIVTPQEIQAARGK